MHEGTGKTGAGPSEEVAVWEGQCRNCVCLEVLEERVLSVAFAGLATADNPDFVSTQAFASVLVCIAGVLECTECNWSSAHFLFFLERPLLREENGPDVC